MFHKILDILNMVFAVVMLTLIVIWWYDTSNMDGKTEIANQQCIDMNGTRLKSTYRLFPPGLHHTCFNGNKIVIEEWKDGTK